MMTQTETTLTRTGAAPVRFKGTLLAEADGKMVQGKEQNRYHVLTVYQTEGGQYVLAIDYVALWKGESDHHYASVCKDTWDVVDALQQYVPSDVVQGYPPGAQFLERQRRLIQDVSDRFDVLVSELLGQHPELFGEEVP